ncbi:hypothetical protein DL765_010122 [Monosporascus sp. GIB2]|nr:hypothetical protein DL765_010122 [Monosporascus sp. GIB2]
MTSASDSEPSSMASCSPNRTPTGVWARPTRYQVRESNSLSDLTWIRGKSVEDFRTLTRFAHPSLGPHSSTILLIFLSRVSLGLFRAPKGTLPSLYARESVLLPARDSLPEIPLVKVIGFGMGFIGSDSAGLAKTHMTEHTVALTIAKAIEEMGGESVAVCSQEPQYTSVRKRVLEEGDVLEPERDPDSNPEYGRPSVGRQS